MREFSLSNRRRRRSTRGSCTMMMRMSRWTQPRDGPRRSREGSSSGGRDFFIRKRSQKTYWKPEKNKLTALKKHDHSLKSKHVDSRQKRANILTNKWWQLEEKKISNSLKKLADSLKKPCWQLEKKIWKQPKKHTDSLKSLFSKRVLWEWEMQSWARVPEKLLRLASVRIFKTASRLASLRRFSGKYFAHSWFCVIVHRVRILRCFGASEGGGASLCVCPSNLVWICGGRERP